MRRAWFIVQMLLALPFALLIAPLAGVWAMICLWLEHWQENISKERPVGIWSRPRWMR